MPTPTYTLIQEEVLGSSQATITFSSIPQTYKDLVVETICSDSNNNTFGLMRLNGDTGTTYSRTLMNGSGTAAASVLNSNINQWYFNYQTSTGFSVFQIMSYRNTSINKTGLMRGTRPGTDTEVSSHLWRNTAAITSLSLLPASGTFNSGSIFRLWGVFG